MLERHRYLKDVSVLFVDGQDYSLYDGIEVYIGFHTFVPLLADHVS